MFDITTAFEFFEKARNDYRIFSNDIANSGLAMNCILSLYHLHEWVWSSWLKGNYSALATIGIRSNKKAFVGWLENNCPHFGLLQELANGTKHCADSDSTKKQGGYGRGPYGVGPYGKSYLLIDLGDGSAERYKVANVVLQEIMQFWESFFEDNNNCGPAI